MAVAWCLSTRVPMQWRASPCSAEPTRNVASPCLNSWWYWWCSACWPASSRPSTSARLGRSEAKVARAQIEGLSKALDLYRLEVGHYPNSEQGLQALVVAPSGEARWTGPYLQKAVPQDPWGRPYIYRQPGENGGEYDLLSMGKDGQPGGDGENAEITRRR